MPLSTSSQSGLDHSSVWADLRLAVLKYGLEAVARFLRVPVDQLRQLKDGHAILAEAEQNIVFAQEVASLANRNPNSKTVEPGELADQPGSDGSSAFGSSAFGSSAGRPSAVGSNTERTSAIRPTALGLRGNLGATRTRNATHTRKFSLVIPELVGVKMLGVIGPNGEVLDLRAREPESGVRKLDLILLGVSLTLPENHTSASVDVQPAHESSVGERPHDGGIGRPGSGLGLEPHGLTSGPN